jgi:hypothetical protein
MAEFIKHNLPKALFNSIIGVIFGGFFIKYILWRQLTNYFKYQQSLLILKNELNILYKESLNLSLNNSYECFSLKPITATNLLESCGFFYEVIGHIGSKAEKYNKILHTAYLLKNTFYEIKTGNNIYYYLSDEHKPRPCLRMYESMVDLQETIKEMIYKIKKPKNIIWVIWKAFKNIGNRGCRSGNFIKDFKKSFKIANKENNEKKKFRKLLKRKLKKSVGHF